VTPASLDGMEAVSRIDFADALARLQELLDREVRVLISFRGTFAGCTMQGRLSRVQTLPPDHSAVNLLIDERQGLMLDPIDTEVLLLEPFGEAWSLEFHLPSGVMAGLEQAEAGERGSARA
jgi:hypothetical protein